MATTIQTKTNGYKSVDEALTRGIEAVEHGQISKGEAALTWVVQKDPANAIAWFWLAVCAPDDHAKAECYRRASEAQGV
ncbi:MAG: hypothetical protein P1P76_05865 [Anaerolineales bacterium]|nr:hypothetical protein [Anaerolineales bacterium]